MMDPGLRSPILKFTFVQGMDGVTNDLEYLQPIGAFTRPFAACRQSETVSELDSLTDYQKELGSDASLNSGDMLGLNSFSGSAGYQQFAQQTNRKQTKTFMLKTYCLRYEAGIAQNASFKWNYTLAFENAVDDLPVTFDGEGPDSACTVEQWRQDHSVEACEKTNIPVWMGFIEQFGTHYTVRLLAGGKMTYQVQFRSEDVRDLRKRGVDIKAEVKLMLGGVSGGSNSGTKSSKSQESHIQSVNYEKETIVIGGKPPGDVSDPAALATWAESVEALPMPVKLELLPLENLLPEAKRAAFTQAVSYYSKAYGMSLMDLQSLSGTAQPIQKVLVNATQVIWAGPPPGFAKCPGDEVVLFGFAIHMNFKVETSGLAQYHIVACTAGREKCDGVGSQNDWMDDERIFMLCSKEPSNDFLQVVGETEAGEQTVEATCPGDTVIAVGFGISLATGFDSAEKVQMEPCQAGQTSCTKNLSEGSVKAFVWMVCTEKTFPGVQDLQWRLIPIFQMSETGTHCAENITRSAHLPGEEWIRLSSGATDTLC
ncbi:mac perforin domain-containing protein [Cystoisospora suis]|uniref:Mac perforin domain-containing protein n=1 Tax=Cystoisospora suis TaxID=483139 RepID=A0A2C6KF04_9APIC|nr:mac perforin domain-containing protein [Cystoisospora suis]